MYTKSLNRVCTISGMGWINCSNFWRAKRIKSRIFNTALSCNNCKTYSHKPSPSENMKTDLKTYSFTSKCLIDTNTPHLSNTLPLLSISHHFNKIRWVCRTFVKLHCTTLQHINWLELRFVSLPYISILLPFLHTDTTLFNSVNYWMRDSEYPIGQNK